jgi:hypothetical protein
MNDVFFGCNACLVMVDAGYRWATSNLERVGIIDRDNPVSNQAVLQASAYWSPEGAGTAWLTDGVLPRVDAFLRAHFDHDVRFGTFEDLVGPDDFGFLNWLDASADPDATPRYFIEVLRLTSWGQVVEWIKSQQTPPWWWLDSESGDAARRRFLELVNAEQPTARRPTSR